MGDFKTFVQFCCSCV